MAFANLSMSANSSECPVCYINFSDNTRLLECGHTLCDTCCSKLDNHSFLIPSYCFIQCPVCKQRTEKEASLLPRNYALQEILQREREIATKKFQCVQCRKMTNNEDFLCCVTCQIDVCLKCITVLHRGSGHKIKTIDDYWKKKESLDRINTITERSKLLTEKHLIIINWFDAIIASIYGRNEKLTQGLKSVKEYLQASDVAAFVSAEYPISKKDMPRTIDEEISSLEGIQTSLDNTISPLFTFLEKHLKK